jgi:hypothetical protein
VAQGAARADRGAGGAQARARGQKRAPTQARAQARFHALDRVETQAHAQTRRQTGRRPPAAMSASGGAGRAPTLRLAAVIVYAGAMGWLEGVVVVYIRALLGIAHTEGLPRADEVMQRMATLPWLMPTEQAREAATLLMLAAVAVLAGTTWRARFGAFLICFGVWDIVYYVALRALIGWPDSLAAMDLLFLIPPHPWWYQPVWVPVAISVVMIGVGVRLFIKRTPLSRGSHAP